jgi:hypothetical protein
MFVAVRSYPTRRSRDYRGGHLWISASGGVSADALVAFYDGDHTRILIAAVLAGVAVLNLMWFAAAIRTALADAGQDGLGATATAASAALGVVFPAHHDGRDAGLFHGRLWKFRATSGLNDFAWAALAFRVLLSPRAHLALLSKPNDGDIRRCE